MTLTLNTNDMRMIDVSRAIWLAMVVLTLVFGAITGIQSCRLQERKAHIAELEHRLKVATTDLGIMDDIHRFDSTEKVRVEAIITEMEHQHAARIVEDGRIIADLEARVRLRQRIRYDTIYIPFPVDTSHPETPRYDVRMDSIAVPQSFRYASQWLDLGGEVERGGLRIDSIRIPNEQQIELERRRVGRIWPKERFYVTVRNSNPHIRTDSLRAVLVKPKGKKEYPYIGHVALLGIIIGRMIGQ